MILVNAMPLFELQIFEIVSYVW